jgi:hypothetical protein
MSRAQQRPCRSRESPSFNLHSRSSWEQPEQPHPKMSNPLYQQFPLLPLTDSIRLLRLDECIYASSNDEGLPKALRCSFEIHKLDNVPQFVALSYTWGSEVSTEHALTIDGLEWPVRENLRDALLHIWDERAWRRQTLWASKRQRALLEKDSSNPWSISHQEVSMPTTYVRLGIESIKKIACEEC